MTKLTKEKQKENIITYFAKWIKRNNDEISDEERSNQMKEDLKKSKERRALVTRSLPDLSSDQLNVDKPKLTATKLNKQESVCLDFQAWLKDGLKDELKKPEIRETISEILEEENIDLKPRNQDKSDLAFEHGKEGRRSLQQREENPNLSSSLCLPFGKGIIIILLLTNVFTIFCLNSAIKANLSHQKNIEFVPTFENFQGILRMPSKSNTVEWMSKCPTQKYSQFLASLNINIVDYGAIQVGDEIWLCGGRNEDSTRDTKQNKQCRILSLLDGQWRTFEHEMQDPRIKPWMFLEGGRVIVRGGVTTDRFSNGCRATQEVFYIDRPKEGWFNESIEETNICDGSIQIFNINCLI